MSALRGVKVEGGATETRLSRQWYMKGVGRKGIYKELVKIALSPKSKANRLQALYIIGGIDVRNLHSLPKNTFDPLGPLAKDSDPELRFAANQALILIKRKKTIYPNLSRWE